MKSFEKKVLEAIRRDSLIPPGGRVLCGLSGGADSVALVRALVSLEIPIGAAHFNHQLRGAEADRDEQFSRALCQELSIPFYSGGTDISALAAERRRGIEETARQERYAFLKSVADREGYDRIATAHHRDDNAETILMMALRGAGPAGLSGMRPAEGMLIRPMLGLPRREVESYLGELPYVTDSSNEETDYTRNRIRKELIPYLEKQFNPNLVSSICSHAKCFAEIDLFLKQAAQTAAQTCVRHAPDGGSVVLKPFNALPDAVRRRVLFDVCERCGAAANLSKTDELLSLADGATGRRIDLGSGIFAERSYEFLNFVHTKQETKSFSIPLPMDGAAQLPDGGSVSARLLPPEEAERALSRGGACGKNTALCDAELLSGLTVTSRRPGDWFQPLGLSGRKKLKDYLIDQKVPRAKRETVPIVRSGGEIVWVCGMRADGRYRLTEHTRRVAELTYREGKENASGC